MRDLQEYKHIFFDMDGTLTPANTIVTLKMKGHLKSLINSGREVIVVSGQLLTTLEKNIGAGTYFLGQNGNHTMDANSKEELWCDKLSDIEKKEIMNHINSIPRNWPVENEDDLVMDRGSQVSYSLLGYNADKKIKNAFDLDFSKRLEILKKHPFVSETLTVSVGGTTTFDYMKKGHNKGFNIRKIIKYAGWNKEDCLYIGDALFPGGNDEAVIGVIDTKQVANPAETEKVIEEILST